MIDACFFTFWFIIKKTFMSRNVVIYHFLFNFKKLFLLITISKLKASKIFNICDIFNFELE